MGVMVSVFTQKCDFGFSVSGWGSEIFSGSMFSTNTCHKYFLREELDSPPSEASDDDVDGLLETLLKHLHEKTVKVTMNKW